MKTFVKHPINSGKYIDAQGNSFALFEIINGVNVSTNHPIITGETEEAVASQEGLSLKNKDIPAAPKSVPKMVTPRQLRLALLKSGVSLTNISNAIDNIPDAATKAGALIEWEYANVFERNHPLIVSLGGQLGLTSKQIDSLFILANTL